MKQFYIGMITFFLACSFNSLKAQTVEFSYNITATLPDGGLGNAGIVFVNNQFWVSEWASNDIHVLDNTGNYIETFQVPGVTGTRSMTTDGTSVYCGAAGLNIFQVNAVTRTLTSTIAVSTTSNSTTRICAYDASLNSGAGGFWIANFNTAITAVNMSGAELSVIPAATHGLTGMYGGAVDGNGNLYVYHQAGVNNDQISVLNLATGIPSGTVYDVFINVVNPLGGTSSLAGGLFITEDIVAGTPIAVGLSQGTPDNVLFGIDFEVLSVDGVAMNNKVTLAPNPASDYIRVSGLSQVETYSIYNVLGAQITKGSISNNQQINIQNLNSGMYILSFDGEQTFKFIKD